MSETKQRHKLLRQLLLSGSGGSTQAQHAAPLAERGMPTTQSTISRDLELLGTIAGDDAVVVITSSIARSASFSTRSRSWPIRE